MIVAQLRGARFSKGEKPWPQQEHDWDIAAKAVEDVANWLGFKGKRQYLMTLASECEKIFLRAKDKK